MSQEGEGENLSFSTDTLQRMVESANGLFIWAATACKFLGEGVSAAERLRILLEKSSAPGSPEENLDKLYLTVLRNSIKPTFTKGERQRAHDKLKEILGSIVVLLSPFAISPLSKLLHEPERRAQNHLRYLHAIIDSRKESTRPLRLHHPSFRDFLLKQRRCTDTNFRVEVDQAHQVLADRCMSVMSASLKQDICGMKAPKLLVNDISVNQVKEYLSPALQYACMYWAQHVQKSGHKMGRYRRTSSVCFAPFPPLA